MDDADEQVRETSNRTTGGNRLLTGLLVLLLSGILLVLMTATALVFDYLGILPLRERLPSWLKSQPWMKEYILEANLLQATDIEKMKRYRYELEVRYETLQAEVKRRELRLERRREQLDERERLVREGETKFREQYEVMLAALAARELALQTREEAVGLREKENKVKRDEYEDSISTMARVYEKMEPRMAADALARLAVEDARQIVLRLPANKSAKILNFVPAEVIQQLTPKKTPDSVPATP